MNQKTLIVLSAIVLIALATVNGVPTKFSTPDPGDFVDYLRKSTAEPGDMVDYHRKSTAEPGDFVDYGRSAKIGCDSGKCWGTCNLWSWCWLETGLNPGLIANCQTDQECERTWKCHDSCGSHE